MNLYDILQPLIRLYDIPDNTFESENEDAEEEEGGLYLM